MKLEMRVWDLDIYMELEDVDADDQLKVLQTAKDLIETLRFMEKVELHITTRVEDSEEELAETPEESEEVAHDDAGEDRIVV